MEPRPNGEGAAVMASNEGDASDANGYTGVVVIHGIGDEQRNETLQEVVNALTYWFNHVAGLAQRATGAGRIWLTTDLREPTEPTDEASGATLTLVAPEDADGRTPLRVEFREVWWAQAFGLPAVGSALRWARLQFREEASRVLLPRGTRALPVQRAQPTVLASAAASAIPPASEAPAPQGSTVELLQDGALRVALWGYAVVQYVWKLVQWVVLAPLLYLLLLVVGLVKLLALIPLSFLQYTITRGLVRVVNAVSLHWIAPLQVYLVDYTRSAAIRQRFERELRRFLQDPACARVVVVAHSMGTVIAYEGLTTTLAQARWSSTDTGSSGTESSTTKPITFLCLSQALRRMWLLEGTDPHRLRDVLPERVRWLHFWGRYDPVCAGPLTGRSLPRREWIDPRIPDPQPAISARLDRCINVAVVNRDSLFLDHTAYWENLEQVVGPIARELVAGHPALERVVAAHLASPRAVLRRRAEVGWRATLALAAGLVAGGGLLLWDAGQGWALGDGIRTFLPQALGVVADALFGGLLRILTLLAQQLSQGTGTGTAEGSSAPSLLGITLAPPTPLVNGTYSVLTALVVVAAGIPLVGRVVAKPSPLAFERASTARQGNAGVVLWLMAFALVCYGVRVVSLTILIYTGRDYPGFVPSSLYANYFAAQRAFAYATLALFVALLAAGALAVVGAARTGRWGWLAALVVLCGIPFAVVVSSFAVHGPFLLLYWYGAVTGMMVCLVGVGIAGSAAVRARRWGMVGSAVLAGAGLVVLFVPFVIFGIYRPLTSIFPAVAPILGTVLNYASYHLFDPAYVSVLLPVLAYALVVGSGWSPAPARASMPTPAPGPRAAVSSPAQLVRRLVVFAGAVFYVHALAGVLALVAMAAALAMGGVGSARRHQWAWLAAMVGTGVLLVPGLVFGTTFGLAYPIYRVIILLGALVGIAACLAGVAVAGRAEVRVQLRDPVALGALATACGGLLVLLVSLLVPLLGGASAVAGAFPTLSQTAFVVRIPEAFGALYLSAPVALLVLLALPVLLWALRAGSGRAFALDRSPSARHLALWRFALLLALLALSASSTRMVSWGAALAAATAWSLSVANVVRRRQWGWLAMLLVITTLVLGALVVQFPDTQSYAIFAGLATGGLAYALFAPPPRSAASPSAADERSRVTEPVLAGERAANL
jgi:hypothetical protein